MNTLRILVAASIATVLATAPLSAQRLDGWGVLGGINRATMTGGFIDVVKDAGGVVNPRYGFTVGGFASLSLATDTWLRPEVAITQKGVRVPPENGLRRRDLDLTYLDVAALVRRSIPAWLIAGCLLQAALYPGRVH